MNLLKRMVSRGGVRVGVSIAVMINRDKNNFKRKGLT